MGEVVAEEGPQERRSPSPGSTPPATRSGQAASRRPSRRPAAGGEGALAALPERRVQALLTEIAASKPDAVYTFFAGGGAVKFVKDYAAAGLKKNIPLYGAGFLTDGTLEAQGADADGPAHHAALRRQPGQRARQRLPPRLRQGLQAAARRLRGAGLRRAQMLGIGLAAVKGDVSKKAEIAAAIEGQIDSPRGAFSVSKRTTRCRTSTCARWQGQGEQAGERRRGKSLADPPRAAAASSAGSR